MAGRWPIADDQNFALLYPQQQISTTLIKARYVRRSGLVRRTDFDTFI